MSEKREKQENIKNPAVEVRGFENVFLFCLNTADYSVADLHNALDERLYFERDLFTCKHYYISEPGDLSISDIEGLDELFTAYQMVKVLPTDFDDFMEMEKAKYIGMPVLTCPNFSDSDMLFGSVRSGRELRYGGNCLIWGDVNAGAEIHAGGTVIVMGTIRGKIIAGIDDKTAVIWALRLDSGQVSVAGNIYDINERENNNKNSTRARFVCMVGEKLFVV